MPKSGNFWLYNNLQKILEIKGVKQKSFIKNHPIYQQAKNWDLSHDQQAGIDMMDIEDERCYYRISSRVRNPIYYLPDYVYRCTHVWTHSEVCKATRSVLSNFNKIVYIYRDPRDAAISAAKFAFTPYMKKYYPHEYTSVKDYLADNFEKFIHDWKWHVLDYLLLKEDFEVHFIAYEHLLNDFSNSIQELSSYLELPVDEEQIAKIYEAVNFKEMKVQNPDHVNRGLAMQWGEHLTAEQKDIVLERAEDLLAVLNYPLSEKEVWKQPIDANSRSVDEIKEAAGLYASAEV